MTLLKSLHSGDPDAMGISSHVKNTSGAPQVEVGDDLGQVSP
jgi:hypothetical protein